MVKLDAGALVLGSRGQLARPADTLRPFPGTSGRRRYVQKDDAIRMQAFNISREQAARRFSFLGGLTGASDPHFLSGSPRLLLKSKRTYIPTGFECDG